MGEVARGCDVAQETIKPYIFLSLVKMPYLFKVAQNVGQITQCLSGPMRSMGRCHENGVTVRVNAHDVPASAAAIFAPIFPEQEFEI